MIRHPMDNSTGRFAFGENWANYADRIDETHVVEATRSLQRLLGEGDLRGLRFLDIGCGSGVHAAAAMRLGAARVDAIDLDPKSVETSKTTMNKFGMGDAWSVERRSVFDLNPETDGQYDVVYSWGVLHHTGDMDRAIKQACSMVVPEGQLLVALYRKTMACRFWRVEKRWYASAGPNSQRIARMIYKRLRDIDLILSGKSPSEMRDKYSQHRGMSQDHDVHDWLGGYPYESITPSAVNQLMRAHGFDLREQWTQRQTSGLLGSGCDEYAFVRQPISIP